MRLKAGGERQRQRRVKKVLRLASTEKKFYEHPKKKLRKISNFKSLRPLLSALFVRAARALLCESSSARS
jgi:hypothetical protein